MTVEPSSPWRSRIVRHADVAPDALAAHPLNFRRHPQSQADAVSGALSTVGWVQDVIVNDRTGRIVDGHLRVELAVARAEPTVPVTFVDLDDDEERLILATLDPLAAMAETDAAQLAALLASVSASNAASAALLADLAGTVMPAEIIAPTEFPEYGDDIETQYECPSCHYAWSGRTAPSAS